MTSIWKHILYHYCPIFCTFFLKYMLFFGHRIWSLTLNKADIWEKWQGQQQRSSHCLASCHPLWYQEDTEWWPRTELHGDFLWPLISCSGEGAHCSLCKDRRPHLLSGSQTTLAFGLGQGRQLAQAQSRWGSERAVRFLISSISQGICSHHLPLFGYLVSSW